MRVENWESKLALIIEETINKKEFKLGVNDCLTFPIKCIETITGIKVFDEKYKSLKEVKKLLKKLKSKDILSVALQTAKENNFKEIDISKAQRGDILYYKIDKADFGGTLGVCLGDKVMFNWSQGINLRLKEDCITAWRVE